MLDKISFHKHFKEISEQLFQLLETFAFMTDFILNMPSKIKYDLKIRSKARYHCWLWGETEGLILGKYSFLCSFERAFELTNLSFYRFFISCLMLEIFLLNDTGFSRICMFTSQVGSRDISYLLFDITHRVKAFEPIIVCHLILYYEYL